MLRRTHLAIVVVLSLLSISLTLQAQEGAGHPVERASSSLDRADVQVSTDILSSRGLSFDDQRRPMCKIDGPEGPCRVEAFVYGERTKDEAGHTCSKLDRSSYVGHCVKGKLEGLSLVIADGSTKLVKEAYISYFHEGRIAYPALKSYLDRDLSFGVREKESGYACVVFGNWDKTDERCALFVKIYGRDLFTESNAQKLRDGTFDFGNYRAKFFEYMQPK